MHFTYFYKWRDERLGTWEREDSNSSLGLNMAANGVEDRGGWWWETHEADIDNHANGFGLLGGDEDWDCGEKKWERCLIFSLFTY
jgi:hypothetical protein